MKMTSAICTALVALIAVAASSTKSLADSGYVTLTIYKAGWVIGGSGGSGTLKFRGRTYGLSTGGLDYGLVFGGSKTVLRGRVTNIDRPSDVAGVYGAAGAGLAVGVRRSRNRIDQSEGRRAGTERQAGWAIGELGPERTCDHVEIGLISYSARAR